MIKFLIYIIAIQLLGFKKKNSGITTDTHLKNFFVIKLVNLEEIYQCQLF